MKSSPTPVVSIVRGTVTPDARADLADRYASAMTGGLPSAIVATYLLGGDAGSVAILTIWRDRAALEAMLASGQEPVARRLIREAGGQPAVEFLDVLAASDR